MQTIKFLNKKNGYFSHFIQNADLSQIFLFLVLRHNEHEINMTSKCDLEEWSIEKRLTKNTELRVVGGRFKGTRVLFEVTLSWQQKRGHFPINKQKKTFLHDRANTFVLVRVKGGWEAEKRSKT